MITEPIDRISKKHIGRNIQRVRIYLGVKQEALAADLEMTQQAISKIEQQDKIDDELLSKISEALGVSPDVIKDFDLEKVIYNINSNNYKDATISEGGTAISVALQINPIEKIAELYERLLESEKEKVEILKNK
jgi:transcriptional regulator with XRE-family HTH domain